MISTAPPRQIAGKIRSVHNRHACPKCRRPFDSGVLTFGLSGSDARWYEDETLARAQSAGPRYIVPVRPDDVSLDDVLAWIEQQRDELDRLVEYVEQQREERRVQREIRESESGFSRGSYPCADCGHPKHRPADECERCGDNPVPLGIDPHDYNRGYGYAY